MTTTMKINSEGVAVITIVNPPVNALASTVLQGLKRSYDEALNRSDVKAIVLTGANGKFSGGFDINAIQAVQKSGSLSALGRVSVELMCKTVEDAGKPSVAAIEGLALGGGLELAMTCHARVATHRAQLGLPELLLGIIPGFGGTQRLPRLIGLKRAIEMMLSSKPIFSEEGEELGLVDSLVPRNELLPTACKLALDIAERRKPWLSTLYRTDKLEPLGEARDIIKVARAQAKERAIHLPHFHACLDAIEEGVINGGYSGILKEEKASSEVFCSDTSKALVHIFFAQRATSKVPGVTDFNLKPRPIKKVGGGFMGSGIATALILKKIPVVLKEANGDFLQMAIDRIKANLQNHATKGKLSMDNLEKAILLLKGTSDYDDLNQVDLVIEAATEDVPLKQQIFSDLEKICLPNTILASTTSTIDLCVLGEKTQCQDRIVGAHFFKPADVMPLLEIVRTKQNSPQTILDLINVGKMLKKVPLVVGNCTGFAVNRTFFPYGQASSLLVNLGVDVYRIDSVIKEFGMPMGPFRLIDFTGLGVYTAAISEYRKAYPGRIYISQLFSLMFQDNRLGESNGRGFYIYDEKGRPFPAPELKDYVEKSRNSANIMPNGKPIVVSDHDIVEMILFPVVNEAIRVLEEGVVVKAPDLDIAAVLAMGFPAHRGGIIFWADSVGADYIYSRMKQWSEMYSNFFKPARLLEVRAKQGISLSAPLTVRVQNYSKARL